MKSVPTDLKLQISYYIEEWPSRDAFFRLHHLPTHRFYDRRLTDEQTQDLLQSYLYKHHHLVHECAWLVRITMDQVYKISVFVLCSSASLHLCLNLYGMYFLPFVFYPLSRYPLVVTSLHIWHQKILQVSWSNSSTMVPIVLWHASLWFVLGFPLCVFQARNISIIAKEFLIGCLGSILSGWLILDSHSKLNERIFQAVHWCYRRFKLSRLGLFVASYFGDCDARLVKYVKDQTKRKQRVFNLQNLQTNFN
jgi:hypothetical protein